MTYETPHSIYGALFVDIQLSKVFADGKAFVDMIPLRPVVEILADYQHQRSLPDFNLKAFVLDNFREEASTSEAYTSDDAPIMEHIENLWSILARPADVDIDGSSKLPLPHPYIVPGGRFREIYYWDSYFTMLGLRESGQIAMIRNMVDNFAYMITRYGHIPNGNRSYYLGRSQPPFFAMMVSLLAEIDGDQIYIDYLDVLIQEHDFWMNSKRQFAIHGHGVQRYIDSSRLPRPESYAEDHELGGDQSVINQQMRTGAESGWDFSSRWQHRPENLSSTYILDIAPVDLNCLLYTLEEAISKGAELSDKVDIADRYSVLVSNRREAILSVFWNQELSCFTDYDLERNLPCTQVTLAAIFPLWIGIASDSQAAAVHSHIATDFLAPGGVVTTTVQSGQQWDAPNGWAPLQWLTVAGLHRYGYTDTALLIAERFTALVERVYRDTGRLMEKYNVLDISLVAGGGEYPVQDGFGWTNGVYLALKSYIRTHKTK